MKIQLSQTLSQKLILTPQMKQSLHILQLPLMDLCEYLDHEVEQNPVLEKQPSDEQPNNTKNDESFIDFATDLIQDNLYKDCPSGDYPEELRKKYEYHQSSIIKPTTLNEVLMQQLRTLKLTLKEQTIGEFIINCIDDNGYLTTPLEQIKNLLEKESIFSDSLSFEDLERILALIQHFDPCGVGARNLKECLLIQLNSRQESSNLVYEIVENFLDDVAKKRVRVIAKKLKTTPQRVEKAITTISSLEPKPGRLFSPSPHVTRSHSEPDVILENNEGKQELIINKHYIPKLRISFYYKKLLRSEQISEETKQYIKEKIKSAQTLMRSLTQRNSTLQRVAECIIDIQKDFFIQGDLAALKPLTLKKVARIVERNESTISRVVNNKYIKTPYGTYKLNYFFSRPVNTAHANSTTLSSETIKSHIYNLICEEKKTTPLNDSKISNLLKKEGITIARRTVAKYREMLKIPPAHRRKKSAKN